MAYSNKKVPNDTSIFPAPQTWMTWIEDRSYTWDATRRDYAPPAATGEGKLRHYHSLADARKALRWVGSKSKYLKEEQRGKFSADWAIYHWDDAAGEWELVHEGHAGDSRDDHPLFKVRFKASDKVNPIDQKMEDKAVESLQRTLQEVAS